MRNKSLIIGVLVAAVVVRVFLIRGGGQYYFFDESKIHIAGAAASLLQQGQVKAALAYPLEPHPGYLADHVGFKLVAIIPELMESRWGGRDRIPVYFFGAFSVLNLFLLASIAYRLSGSARAYALTLAAAASSATLLIYARHLVPYDLAMFFALLTLWLGVKRPASPARTFGVGALSAWSFFCYYGYWPLAGTAVLLHLLWSAESAGGFLRRLGVAVLGFAAVLGLMLGLSELGSGHLVADTVAVFQHSSFAYGVFRSWRLSWLYLFDVERVALLAWVAFFLAGFALERREWAGGKLRFRTPLGVVAVGLLTIYAIFVIDSDFRHSLTVHGRHSRQLAVFLLLGFGLGADRICARTKNATGLLAGLTGLLLANALWTFWIPLRQEFPDEFKRQAESILAARPPITDGRSYYRLVNVDHYIVEPEVLRTPPRETLLARRHPLQYLPFLFEGEIWAVEQSRQRIDHRMRLVRMEVPPAERVEGEPYGQVTLDLSFAPQRAGFSEPLLALGPPRAGNLFFITYLDATRAVLGFEYTGGAVIRSEPFLYAPGQRHRLQLFCGALLPPTGSIAGVDPRMAEAFRQWICAKFDDHWLLGQALASGSAAPGEVYAGVNTVGADSAEEQFSGEIAGVVRGGPPARVPPAAVPAQFGPVVLKINLPAAGTGAAEPLLVAGKPGRAILGYVRVSAAGEARFGLETWGVGSQESEALHLPADDPVEVEFSCGSLLPEPGSAAWRRLPTARQQEAARTVRITVNGTVVLQSQAETPELTDLPVYFGLNPLGGSTVGPAFAGTVLSHARGALEGGVDGR